MPFGVDVKKVDKEFSDRLYFVNNLAGKVRHRHAPCGTTHGRRARMELQAPEHRDRHEGRGPLVYVCQPDL